MNESSKKTGRYAVGGAAALCLFILLGWFAFREGPSSTDQRAVKVEPTKPHAVHVAPAFEPADELSSEEPTNRPNDSATTNAAVIYWQAFDLFNALSNEQKTIVGDWRTNVDASVEAELCEKLRPICELMHQAAAVTNCDWGINPITFDTPLPHLNRARNIARAAIWSAAHCQSNDVTGAMDDAVSALRVGQQASRSALIGCFVDMAIQGLALSYVAANLGSFGDSDAQRLAAALDDPAYEEAPSRAMEQEADMVKRFVAHLASLSPDESQKELSEWAKLMGGSPPNLDRASVLAEYQQVADSERELAKALASSSEDDYEAWLKHSEELRASSPLAEMLLPAFYGVMDRARRAEVNRAMVVAGLAVAENGTEALSAHLDPVSGKPFVYTKTDGGFELQSSYQVNDKPMKMQFK